MIRFDDVIKEERKQHNPIQPKTSDHIYRILIISGSGSGKINSLSDLINQQPAIDKVFLYAKDPYKSKYQFLINKHKNTGIKYFNDSKAFIEYSNDMNDIYKNTEEYNSNKKRKTLTVFNDIITDMLCNKRRYTTVAELFPIGRKLNISYVFITQSYFAIPKNIRVIPMHFFIMKI